MSEVPAATDILELLGLVAVGMEFVLPAEMVVFESVAGTGGANEMPELVRVKSGSVLLNERVGSEPVAVPPPDPLSEVVVDPEPANVVFTKKSLPVEEKSPVDESADGVVSMGGLCAAQVSLRLSIPVSTLTPLMSPDVA